MKRDSDSSIIPKIIVILGTVSVIGIILLFFRQRPLAFRKFQKPSSPEKLFAQVIAASVPKVIQLWEDGDDFVPKEGTTCPSEIAYSRKVGRGYYQCQPHLWQCYWEGGLKIAPAIKIDLFGQTYHVKAMASFKPIASYSELPRFYEASSGNVKGRKAAGYLIELKVAEIPGHSQHVMLFDTCRDTFLPERVYGYGPAKGKGEGFIWDNFDRKLFIDKFYVSNQKVNEWKVLTGDSRLELNKELWPAPARLTQVDQKKYCAFYGKKLLEAKLFDAAAMTPADFKDPIPEFVSRPQTPWQRDVSKTFLGTARINPDYQLTPLDCQLAQVMGCPERLFSLDSASWTGMNYGLGFEQESFENSVEPQKNLKVSSSHWAASSEWHELGLRKSWDGTLESEKHTVAFRCYEEVSP